MIKLKAYKFRLYPNKTQKVLFIKTFGCVRFYWNSQVEQFNSYDKETNPKPIFKTSTEIRNGLEWMKEVSAAAIQQKERDFKQYKTQMFLKTRKTKIGFPQFKKRSNRQSYRLPNQKFKLLDRKILLEKIGKVKIVQDRVIPDNAKFMSVTISKTPTGKYFASILVEQEINYKPKTNNHVGIDVGIKQYAVQSDGVFIDNPKWFRESQVKLRKAQKHLSRKQKGSNRRNKQRIKVAKLYEKVANQRNWFLHNYSTQLINYYDIICIEDLNISGMVKNRKLAKSISDTGWSTFFSILKYKADWYGKTIVKIDRWEASSKICCECGWKNTELTLNDREFVCEECGSIHDRDEGAAKNIMRVGVNALNNRTQSDSKTSFEADCVEVCKVEME